MTIVVGIDAGGSKTRVVAAAREDLKSGAAGRLAEALLGPGNYRHLGDAGVRLLAREIVARLQIEQPQETRVVGGFAGAGTPQSQSAIQDAFAAEGFRQENLIITSDAGLLLEALGGSGIVLIAGTGSICMGRRQDYAAPEKNGTVRAGGYGYRLGSEAGGYCLGMGAIEAALKIEDGRRQEATVLYKKVREYFGLENLQEIAPILNPAEGERGSVQEKVAGLARIVLQAASAGDAVAAALVERAVADLADYVGAVCDKLGAQKSVVGLYGGLFADPHSEELLVTPLRQHLFLRGLELEFETLGTRESDRDPLVEAMRSVSG
jgi:N-acetylglucosamine kinase-like BadF-type ATPase